MLKTLRIVHREINPSKKKTIGIVKNIYFAKQKIEVYKNFARNITKSQTSATCFFTKKDSLN